MIFLISLGEMIILFPQNMRLFFRRKIKDDLSPKKIHGNMIYSSNIPKDGLSKYIAQEYGLSHIVKKDDISFSSKFFNFF